MKRISLLIACTMLSLCACDAPKETNVEPSASAESSNVMNSEKDSENPLRAKCEQEQASRGLELMKKESIGEKNHLDMFHLGMSEKDVVKYLREPDRKEEPKPWQSDGLYRWVAHYSHIGWSITYEKMDENAESRVASIDIETVFVNPGNIYEVSTSRGIRVGSKRQEVLDAYKDVIECEGLGQAQRKAELEKHYITVGSVNGGIVFALPDKDEDTVKGIFMGAAAELTDNQLSERCENERFARGFEFQKKEKIGEIRLEMREEDVVKLLGEPTKKETPMLSDATGEYVWSAEYSPIGLSVYYGKEDENSEGTVSIVSVDSDLFKGSTARGIRIGSTRQEVLDAYKDALGCKWMEQVMGREEKYEGKNVSVEGLKELIEVGSTYGGGISFGISEKDKVKRIGIGEGYPN